MFIEKINFNTDGSVGLTAYIPDVSKEMPNMKVKPAMLVIPGGAYKFCSDREAEPVALAYTARGYNAFVLRYSLNEDAAFPKPLDDAKRALKTIKENCERWHTDPNRIAVIGFSAGGHLAAALSTMADDKPFACLLGYPCTLSSTSPILAKPVETIGDFVTKDTPPTFIFSASDDDVVPIENSLEYASALAKNSVPFEMHIFSKGGHGFSLATDVVYADENALSYVSGTVLWFDASLKWLKSL